ncbi:MAG: amidohydrolase family protein [Verrucomicrobia bacterium]|nr:amidohydrolase family protein [Verrucomicrobiota bacterium]
MNLNEFALSPTVYGLPTRDELVELRIWDCHYHGFVRTDNDRKHFETMRAVERLGIERVIALDIGGDTNPPWNTFIETEFDRRKLEILRQYPDKVSGVIRIDPSDPDASCRKMEKWIRNGPCIGIKYTDGSMNNRDKIPCSHPNNDPIIRMARELGAVVYVCAWFLVGGSPCRVDGANRPGSSTPLDIARLAQRFPDVPIICGHSGGEWELAPDVIEPHRNVYFEFAGSDPHSGSVDYVVKKLGADRITWGGHGPSRSYATELSKVLDADLSKTDRMKVLGRNYRRITAGIFASKGIKIDV